MAFAIASAASGCGGSDPAGNQGPFGGVGGTAGTAGGAAAGGISGGGGIGIGNAPGSGGAGAAPGTGGSTGNCGGMVVDAMRVPLGVYIMFDDSGSMIPWWGPVTQATVAFLNDPASVGIWAGIQFFGPEAPQGCDVARYATPLVPLAPLPGNAGPIQAAFPGLPLNQTPTEPAMQGAVQHAQQFAMQQGIKTVVLLVTDGEPAECNSTVAGVAAAAAGGLNGTPSIQTFVVGLGFSLGNLNQIAQAGGTGQAILADPANPGAVSAALNQIRAAALPCDYEVPPEAFSDLSLVNVEYTPPGNQPATVPQTDEANCPNVQQGWFYDDPVNPTRILVCPQTCDLFNQGGSVNVRVGCPTVVVR